MEDVSCTLCRLHEKSRQYCQYSNMRLQKHGIELISATEGIALKCEICQL